MKKMFLFSSAILSIFNLSYSINIIEKHNMQLGAILNKSEFSNHVGNIAEESIESDESDSEDENEHELKYALEKIIKINDDILEIKRDSKTKNERQEIFNETVSIKIENLEAKVNEFQKNDKQLNDQVIENIKKLTDIESTIRKHNEKTLQKKEKDRKVKKSIKDLKERIEQQEKEKNE